MAAPLTVTHTAAAELPFLEERGPERAREKVISVEPSVDTSHPLLFAHGNKPILEPVWPPQTSRCYWHASHHTPFHRVAFCTQWPHSGACWLDPQHFMTASGGACKACLLTTLAACPEHLGHQERYQAFLTEKASS